MYWCIIFIMVVKQMSCDEIYGGESFPIKYLSPDGHVVTSADMDYYIRQLLRPLKYYNEAPNDTDVSASLSAFFTKSIMKRVIKDYGAKLQNNQTESLKKIIHLSENMVSHYVYTNVAYDWDDMEFRVSKLFISDEAQVLSIRDFNRNRLRRWILTRDNNMNEYLEAMDNATMPKEIYGYLTDKNPNDKYFIGMYASDKCVSHIPYNGEPIDVTKLRKCKTDEFCEKHIYSNPSIGYYLSHRFVNAYLRITYGCYIRSESEDFELMDQLCGNMYRETVYLARRGYFSRDLFLELIALCGFLGYEEFHRRNWFYKASSWINEHGCVVEDRNFIKNRTRFVKTLTGVRERSAYNKYFCKVLLSECDQHPTALVMVVLSHAIRHAARFMNAN